VPELVFVHGIGQGDGPVAGRQARGSASVRGGIAV
jgi:hypothetical protein